MKREVVVVQLSPEYSININYVYLLKSIDVVHGI